MEIIWIMGAFFIGGLVHGSVGFGSGLIGIALLGLIMPLRDAAAMNAFAALAINFVIIVRLRQYLSLNKIGLLLPAVLLGVPFGVIILAHAPSGVLNILHAAILVISSIQSLLRGRFHFLKPWHPIYIGIPCGLLSGALTGAYGTGGPPLAACMLSLELIGASMPQLFRCCFL